MKRIETHLVNFLVLALAINIFFACSKDDEKESDKPYVGEWETSVYDALDPISSTQVKQKMEFTFTNDEFTDLIFQGVSEAEITATAGIKGEITPSTTTENQFGAEIMELSLDGGTTYVDKRTDEVIFDQTFAATLGQLLYEEFDATYIIDGNKMQLIIPIKYQDVQVIDTLNLTRK